MTQQNVEGFVKKRDMAPSAIYMRVFDHCLAMTTTTKEEGESKGWEGPIRTNNPQTGQPVLTWAEKFDFLVCHIVDCNKFDRKFDNGGKVTGFTFTLQANDSLAYLRFKWCERVLKRFLKVAPNVNFRLPIYISVFPSKENGKVKDAVSFRQPTGPDDMRPAKDWDKVPEFYNKAYEEANRENPDVNLRMPPPVEDEFAGTWNFDAQNAWLGKQFVANSLPKIKAIANELGIKPPSDGAKKQEGRVEPMAEAAGIGSPDNRTMMEQARANSQANQQQTPEPEFPPAGTPSDDEIPF